MQETSRIFIDETERKPNLYAAKVMTGVVGVLAIVWLLNQTGVFEVERVLMNVSLLVCLGISLFMQFVTHSEKWIENPAMKYVFMTAVLAVVFTLSFLLNVHAILAYVLPILLATQYRSKRVSLMALIGSCVCCFFSPILAYRLNTFSLVFMTGFVQAFCDVTVVTTPDSHLSVLQAIGQIALFWSLPQALTIMAYGGILFSITKIGILGVNDHIQVMGLTTDLNRQSEDMMSMQEKVLFSMSDIIESRDVETGGHVRRTSEIVKLLVYAMRDDPDAHVTDSFCASVIKCAPMHDLGKIAVPDTILKKQESLTDAEYEIVKQHPQKSAEIIERALTGVEDDALLTVAVNIAKYHHERVDGKGYPAGLMGSEIPLEARIMAIADVYDALVSERCYKASMSFDEAFDTIENSMGSQFDTTLNPYLISCRRDIERFYTEAKNEA